MLIEEERKRQEAVVAFQRENEKKQEAERNQRKQRTEDRLKMSEGKMKAILQELSDSSGKTMKSAAAKSSARTSKGNAIKVKLAASDMSEFQLPKNRSDELEFGSTSPQSSRLKSSLPKNAVVDLSDRKKAAAAASPSAPKNAKDAREKKPRVDVLTKTNGAFPVVNVSDVASDGPSTIPSVAVEAGDLEESCTVEVAAADDLLHVTATSPVDAAIREQELRLEALFQDYQETLSQFRELRGSLVSSAVSESEEPTTPETEESSQKRQISSVLSLEQYYVRSQRVINEAFLAAAVVSTGQFSMQSQSSAVGAALDLVAFVTQSMPFVGAVASAVATVNSVVSEAQVMGRFQRVSRLNPTSSPVVAAEISELLARKLTIAARTHIEASACVGASNALERTRDGVRAVWQSIDRDSAVGFFGADLPLPERLAVRHCHVAIDHVMSGRIDAMYCEVADFSQSEWRNRLVDVLVQAALPATVPVNSIGGGQENAELTDLVDRSLRIPPPKPPKKGKPDSVTSLPAASRSPGMTCGDDGVAQSMVISEANTHDVETVRVQMGCVCILM